jgi:uncharacterized membrane protein
MQSPQREWAFLGSSDGFSLLLKRNCSISPKGMILVFAVLALVTLGIATGFAMAGAWLVLPFAGLEVAALVFAFIWTARHAGDYERIEVASGRVWVEVAEGRALRRHALSASALRVHLASAQQRVLLAGTGAGEIEVGRHLDAQARLGLADELKRTLSL